MAGVAAVFRGLGGASMGRRAGPSGVGMYSYCLSGFALADWLAGGFDPGVVSSLTIVFRGAGGEFGIESEVDCRFEACIES